MALNWSGWQRVIFALLVVSIGAAQATQLFLIQRLHRDVRNIADELERVKSSVDDVESELSRTATAADSSAASDLENEVATGFLEVQSELASIQSELASIQAELLNECGD